MMSAPESTSIEVEIYGASYQVRGQEDAEYLRELAELVDRKMQDIADQMTSADTAKVAILAALNLADELTRSRKRQDGDQVAVEERVTELTKELTAVLEV